MSPGRCPATSSRPARRQAGDQRLARRRPPGAGEKLDQLVSAGGVLGGLVVAPASGEPGEAHGQARVGLDPAPGGGVVRGQGELGGQDLKDQPRLEPDVRLLPRVDPGRRCGAVSGASRSGSAARSASENPVPHLDTVRNRSAAGS